jgi:CheY-like chemotaxis protein/HPt (histidine-containing phosphotransfer) domain-containing protein
MVKYDAVFMDHMMPGMDGVEAMKRIRKIGTKYAKSLPIIAFTANAIAGNEEKFIKSGFDAFLSKPIDIVHLDAVIRQWVRDKSKEKELSNTNAATAAAETSGNSMFAGIHIDGLDLHAGLERFGGDGESYIDILRSFADNTPTLLDKLENTDDLKGYAIAVHGIKGSGRGIGANILGDRAEALEKAAKADNAGFIKEKTPDFINTARKLVADIWEVIGRLNVGAARPKKNKPDVNVLKKLQAACEVYDMDGVDAALDELDAYQYESDASVFARLKQSAERMDFDGIIAEIKKLI